MKIYYEEFFIKNGAFFESEEFHQIRKELETAIKKVTWNDTNNFIINPIIHGNGVTPIKENFIKSLTDCGWEKEKRMSLANGMYPGPVDVIKKTSYGTFAVEWETGNISSSHRALNKMAIGIIQDIIIGGILILPIRKFAQYLTDRIGNLEEIEPYFPLFRNVIVDSGIMGVIAVDCDGFSDQSPLIPKGTDGRAKKSKESKAKKSKSPKPKSKSNQ